MSAEWEVFWNQIQKGAYKTILNGLLTTVEIAVFGLLIGFVIGTILAIVKVLPKTNNPVLRVLDKIVTVYVGFFRGTPMTVQLLIGYFVMMPAIHLSLEGVYVAIAIFGLNSGAYVSEIMRGGINSVDPGQLEAARALGIGYGRSMIKVVIPQAFKNILPTMGNEFIALTKDTSIVSFIAVVDVTKAFRSIADANYEYIIPYLMLAVVYLVLVALITVLVRVVERRLSRSDRQHK